MDKQRINMPGWAICQCQWLELHVSAALLVLVTAGFISRLTSMHIGTKLRLEKIALQASFYEASVYITMLSKVSVLDSRAKQMLKDFLPSTHFLKQWCQTGCQETRIHSVNAK